MTPQQPEFVVFDVETTGLSPERGDRIIEIAAVKVKGDDTIDTFDSLINPERKLDEGAMQVNHITEEMVKDAPISSDILPKMIDFIGGACLVGHNVSFDLSFLCYELSLSGRKLRNETPAIDTLKMSKHLVSHLSSHKLIHIDQHLGIASGVTHRALHDTKLTVCVMNRLLELAKAQKITTFEKLYKAYGVNKPNYKIMQASQQTLF